MRTCVCRRCGIPLSTEVSEAVYFKTRAQCITPAEHDRCDKGALSILAPSLSLQAKISLVQSICLRRIGAGDVTFDVGCLFIYVARFELLCGLWIRSIQTCNAIKAIFATLPPEEYKQLLAKINEVHNLP